ncbi:MAG: hypothetical protein HC866_11880 [Leptolyngbyaceae cyanobacterium RU_5_1]|nr:hypothetical protein [Leptolyngbyaceae cyanobacterium RU_5_1]
MSQTFEMDDDLRPEYDFTQLPVVARGQGRKRSTRMVQLDPDVAAIFPDSAAVNEGLRLLIRLIQRTSPQPDVQSVTASKEP